MVLISEACVRVEWVSAIEDVEDPRLRVSTVKAPPRVPVSGTD